MQLELLKAENEVLKVRPTIRSFQIKSYTSELVLSDSIQFENVESKNQSPLLQLNIFQSKENSFSNDEEINKNDMISKNQK